MVIQQLLGGVPWAIGGLLALGYLYSISKDPMLVLWRDSNRSTGLFCPYCEHPHPRSTVDDVQLLVICTECASEYRVPSLNQLTQMQKFQVLVVATLMASGLMFLIRVLLQ